MASGTSGSYVLPAGWETAVSRSTGDVYYVHTATGESTYDWPAATAQESVADGPAPRGRWRALSVFHSKSVV